LASSHDTEPLGMAAGREQRTRGLRWANQCHGDVGATIERKQRAIDHDLGCEVTAEQVDGDGSGRPGTVRAVSGGCSGSRHRVRVGEGSPTRQTSIA
jgi:hypothetical protein